MTQDIMKIVELALNATNSIGEALDNANAQNSAAQIAAMSNAAASLAAAAEMAANSARGPQPPFQEPEITPDLIERTYFAEDDPDSGTVLTLPEGKTSIVGSSNNEIIIGGKDSNGLISGGGNDILFGGRGIDVLVSNGGNNLLTGGFDRDIFVITEDAERTTVTDYNAAEADVLVFSIKSGAETLFDRIIKDVAETEYQEAFTEALDTHYDAYMGLTDAEKQVAGAGDFEFEFSQFGIDFDVTILGLNDQELNWSFAV